MTRQHVSRIVSGTLPNPGILTVERMLESVGATMAELYADENPSWAWIALQLQSIERTGVADVYQPEIAHPDYVSAAINKAR
jgi:hypothetical protein